MIYNSAMMPVSDPLMKIFKGLLVNVTEDLKEVTSAHVNLVEDVVCANVMMNLSVNLLNLKKNSTSFHMTMYSVSFRLPLVTQAKVRLKKAGFRLFLT